MEVQRGYDQWAAQYDTDINRTRDLEATAIRSTLHDIIFKNCLEIGCGTGKNTGWLSGRAVSLTAADFSIEMLARAREKVTLSNTRFVQADINGKWAFGKNEFDLICFSLVLEHISDLDHVFEQSAIALNKTGHIYIGELHPNKQYAGSKARFETEEGTKTLQCFNHHISEFTAAAQRHGFRLTLLNEYFDNDDRTGVPRILSLLFQKC